MIGLEIKAALDARAVDCSQLSNGDVFFRRSDGQGMYIRPFTDGTYDWSVNAAPNDTNLMDFRAPERHKPEEVIRRIDDFLRLTVAGRVVIDTLGLIDHSMRLGLSRQDAERFAETARGLVLEMHESGMDAHEIRTRFGEVHEQLKMERLGSKQSEV